MSDGLQFLSAASLLTFARMRLGMRTPIATNSSFALLFNLNLLDVNKVFCAAPCAHIRQVCQLADKLVHWLYHRQLLAAVALQDQGD